MSDYNQYITSINKIFDYLAKMKAGWNNLDNLNYIESIEEYKRTVINNADTFINTKVEKKSNKASNLETLGND